jgi:hypothetical protein
MFQIGQLVFVKSVSDRVYLGMITDAVLYLNNFEEAFYSVYLIESGDHVTVPSGFIKPAHTDTDTELRETLFGSGSSKWNSFQD